MNIKSALKSSASRFAHLGGAQVKTGAAKPKDKDKETDPPMPAADGKETAAKVPEDTVLDEDDEDDDGSDTLDDEELEEELDAKKKAKAAGHGPALKAAAKAERRRCAAILGSKHAKGRVAMACELAFDPKTTISAEHAVRILSTAPQEQSTGTFAAAMAAQPKVDIGQDPAKPKAETPGQRLIANARARALASNKTGAA
jgi:hypothetical protein